MLAVEGWLAPLSNPLLYVNSDKGKRLLSVYHTPGTKLATLDLLCSPLNPHPPSLTDVEAEACIGYVTCLTACY